MKKNKISLILGCLISTSTLLLAQDDINLNLLAAPAPPAATMLGISSSDIDKPRDLSEFLAYVGQKTNNFSQFPGNYAIEIAPAWLFTRNKIDFQHFASNSLGNNLWQGLSLSAAVNNSGADIANPLTQVAFGLKTSILRGRSFGKENTGKITKVQKKLQDYHQKLKLYLDTDTAYQQLIDNAIENPADTAAVRQRQLELYKSFSEEFKFEADLNDIRFDRVGFKLDLNFGIVQDFVGGQFEGNQVSQLGTWLSGGYEWEGGFSFLGIARYLQKPNASYRDENDSLQVKQIESFDAGFRVLFGAPDKPFKASAEGIYRSTINLQTVPESWRLAINLEYQFKPNMSLNFSYGRDFDGLVTKKGNVIALLSFFTGLGNNRPLPGA